MTFTLDTSGAVEWPDGEIVRWNRLSPFAQGYIEALLRDLDKARMDTYRAAPWGSRARAVPITAGFSWFAPETLARIMEDCAEMTAVLPADLREAKNGRAWWKTWQAGASTYPALTPYLGDDGKVYLRETQNGGRA